MDITAGRIHVYTPPRGPVLNSNRYAVPYPSVLFAVKSSFIQPPSMLHINLTPTPCHVGMVEIPPTPNATPTVTPVVNPTNYGMAFWQSISRSNTNFSSEDNSTLGNASGMILMINGCTINRYLQDANGNRISSILRQLFGTIFNTFGHFLLTIIKCIETYSTLRITYVISTTVLSISKSYFYPDVFCHPILFEAYQLNVTRLGIDTWVYTVCARKHEFV